MRRTVLMLLIASGCASTALADSVKDFAAWTRLSPAERSTYAGAFVDGQLVGNGSREAATYYIGVTTCLAREGLTSARLAGAITSFYQRNPAAKNQPPGAAILRSVMRGTCLSYINAERKKQKLEPLGTSDG